MSIYVLKYLFSVWKLLCSFRQAMNLTHTTGCQSCKSCWKYFCCLFWASNVTNMSVWDHPMYIGAHLQLWSIYNNWWSQLSIINWVLLILSFQNFNPQTCYHLYHKTAILTRTQNYNLWQRLCANLNLPNTQENMNAIQNIGHLIILKQKVDLAI